MTDPCPVGNLTVTHQTFDSASPCDTFWLETRECLLYALIGKIRVYANGAFLGTIGGRASVTEPLAHVVRFPAGTKQDVILVLEGFAADCLIVSCDAMENHVTRLPYQHRDDAYMHPVGSGTHQRTVVEVPTPPGFHISAGETFQEAGMTSSWPAHATQADLLLYHEGKTTWEEYFYCICPEPAQTVLVGLYPGGQQVQETRMLQNGEIVQMPLGSHKVTASNNGFLYYAWFYCGSALRKEYCKFSTDTGVYLR